MLRFVLPVLFAVSAFTTSVSQAATLIDCSLFSRMDLLDGNTCAVGDKLLQDFTYTGTIDAASISVTPLSMPANNPGLQFAGPWQIASGESETFELAYSVAVQQGFNNVVRGASAGHLWILPP